MVNFHHPRLMAAQPRVALLALLLLSACAGGQTWQAPAAPQLATAQDSLAQPGAPRLHLPAPATLSAQLPPHGAAFVPADLVQPGVDYEDGLPHNRVSRSGESAEFAPNYSGSASGATGLAYAIWRFHADDFSGPAELLLNWSDPPASEGDVLVGLGNFSAGRWDWAAWTPGNYASFGELPRYVDGSGNALVCVLVAGTDTAVLTSLRLGDLQLSGQLLPQQQAGLIGTAVALDASQLVPNGGTIANYDWDFNGDGVFEFDSDLEPLVNNTYDTAGLYMPAVRVRTDEGLTAVASASARILGNTWEITTLADGPQPEDAAFDPQIALVNGKPAVSYMLYQFDDPGLEEFDVQRVYYRQAADSQAHTWGAPVEAVAYDWYAYHLADMLEVNGAPAVVYQGEGGQLDFVRATSADGASWPDPVNAATDMDTSQVSASLTILGGVPHIAYIAYNSENAETMAQQAVALDPLGAAWQVFSVPGLHDYELSLTDIDGAVLAYWRYDVDPPQLQVRRNSAPDGSSFWNYLVGWPTEARYTTLGTLGTRMAVFYIVGGVPRVLYAGDLAGTPDTWNSAIIDTENFPCDYGTLAGPCLGNEAVACYQDAGEGQLIINYLNLADQPQPEVVDDDPAAGVHCSMVISEGVPMIVYEEWDGYSVRVAVLR